MYWTEPARCAAVFYVFLCAGVRVTLDQLRDAWADTRTVWFIQGYVFVASPVLYKLVTTTLGFTGVHSDILQGIMSASCMPPAVAVGVALSVDDAASVVATTVAAVLCPLVTPLLLLCTCGATTLEPLTRLPLRSFISVVLPLALGRMLATPLASMARWRYKVCGEVVLALLLYGACCDALLEIQGELDANDVITAVILVLSMTCATAALCWQLSSLVSASSTAVRVALLCASKDCLACAMPRLHILFGSGPLLSLPLLIQQPAQLLLSVVLSTIQSIPQEGSVGLLKL